MAALDYLGVGIKSSAKMKAGEVLVVVPGANTISYVWGYTSDLSNTEHHSGLAVDFMVFANKPLGDTIYDYLWANRVRLGVVHIIWHQSITSTVVSPGQRRHMGDRGNPTNNHMDHVHVLFTNTNYIAPTVTKSQVPPVTHPVLNLHLGSKGTMVRFLQNGLNKAFPAYSHLVVDGDYGAKTVLVVREFQRRTGLSVDGIVGPATAAKLATFGVNL